MPSCEVALQQSMNAYHQLMVGAAAVVKVKTTAGIDVEYRQKSLPALKEYIQDLNMACPCVAANAILGIGRRRSRSFNYTDGFRNSSLTGGCCG